jgi:hypothetical protein
VNGFDKQDVIDEINSAFFKLQTLSSFSLEKFSSFFDISTASVRLLHRLCAALFRGEGRDFVLSFSHFSSLLCRRFFFFYLFIYYFFFHVLLVFLYFAALFVVICCLFLWVVVSWGYGVLIIL